MPTLELEVTQEDIARRAHEISQSDECGSDEENWHRAGRELRGEPDGASHPAPGQSAGSGDGGVDPSPDEH
jgi:hypothetical protein